jgi:hypothetical protein
MLFPVPFAAFGISHWFITNARSTDFRFKDLGIGRLPPHWASLVPVMPSTAPDALFGDFHPSVPFAAGATLLTPRISCRRPLRL